VSDKSWDKDWLVFSRKARRGVFVLLFIFIIVAVLPRVYRNHFMDSPLDIHISKLSTEKNQKDKQRLEKANKEQSESSESQKKESFSYNIPKNPFNPNDYKFEDWKSIGFSEKQVETIINYQQNGGKFRVKEDVKKLYVIDEELYLKLYSVIDLPDSTASTEKRNFNKKEETDKVISLNINTASIEQLKKVSGIGPFFAKQIVELREDYGGIHDLNQLLEIYRMDEEKLLSIKESLVIEKTDIKKININTATRKELNRHKEITWNIANSIVTMRENHGDFGKTDDLLKSILIDQEKLEKLKPYVTVE
jgi:competence ComEA-like helix-hairpin-helix protein